MMSSPEEMAKSMIANMPEKTGKSLEQWLGITLPSEHQKQGQILKWLKTEFGVTHGFANLIAHKTLEKRYGKKEDEDWVAIQYSGAKSELKPVYDKILSALTELGEGLEIAPKKAYVSLRRKKQFALIQPSTKTRIDVGINLKDTAPQGRLEASGSFNSMVSHRVRLASPDDVNDELIGWLKQAFELAL